MENLPSNSHKSREQRNLPEKKVEKVISGNIVSKKPGLGAKLAEIFFSEDVGNVRDYIITDLIIPGIKEGFLKAWELLLYGGTSRRGGNQTRTNYGGYSSGRSNNRPQTNYARPASTSAFDSIIFERRGEAELVLDNLCELISIYGVATVSDFYDLIGKSGNYTDNKWGWDNLQSARVRPVRGGFIIELPRAMQLD